MADPRLMTDKQNRFLFALLNDDLTDHVTGEKVTDRHDWASEVLGVAINTFSSLSVTDARKLIDRLAEPIEQVPDDEAAF